MFLMQRYEETSLTKLGCFKIHIRIQNDYLVLSRFRLALLLVPYCPYLRILLDSLKPGSSQVGVHIYIASNCNHLNSTYEYSVYWFQISLYFISSVLMDLPFDPIITFVTILINYVGWLILNIIFYVINYYWRFDIGS